VPALTFQSKQILNQEEIVRLKPLSTLVISAALILSGTAVATADSAKPGQSMTHMKTAAGIASTFETAGVVIYVQGGATSSVIGDSISSANGQLVFHIPVTANKAGVQHKGSNIVFFNTANNLQLVLSNPVIDLEKGVVTATVPQAANQSLSIMTITNAATLKPKITNDRKAGLRTTSYKDVTLVLSPGVAATIATVLALPASSLPDGLAFGSTDVTLYSKIARTR
jgi:hypothetical protein